MTDNVYDPIGWRFCVAPMLDLTDRHCRYFHRLLSHRARLYTEMVTTGALVHGDVPHHLDFSEAEHRVALQLGGSDPKDLAHGAKLAQQWGYDEVNLNCGCPSERVQKGSFGACLMAEPGLVADCVKAMQDATHLPVTIKHRVGIDANNDTSVTNAIVTFSASGANAGVGMGVAINNIDVQNTAQIIDNDGTKGESDGLKGEISASKLNVNAETTGLINSVSVAGGMTSSGTDSEEGFLDKVKAPYNKMTEIGESAL